MLNTERPERVIACLVECAGKNQGDREAHPEQVRLPTGPARRSGEDRFEAGRAAVCGLGVVDGDNRAGGLSPRENGAVRVPVLGVVA